MGGGRATRSFLSRVLDLWEARERRLLYLFFGILLFLWSGVIVGAFVSGEWSPIPLVERLIGVINFTCFMMVIFLVGKFKGLGVIPFRVMWRFILYASLVSALIVSVVFMMDAADVIDVGMSEEEFTEASSNGELALIIVVLFFVFSGIIFVITGVVTLIMMGFVGVLYLFMVGLVPLDLRWVKRITMRGHLKARALAWVLLIPEHLDTGTLTIRTPERESEFPWRRFWFAMTWMMAFNILVAVYVSLNPFFLRSASLEELIGFMTSGYIIVPIVVIPWLAIERLDARIEGPVKDFRLYEGIRSRLVRTFLTLGTLMIFIRFALEDISMERILYNFGGYIAFSFLLIFAITFIYFNYFEFELARTIADRLPGLMREDEGFRAPEVDTGGVEEEGPNTVEPDDTQS